MNTNWEAYMMWRSCSNKKKYKREGQARRAAHKLQHRAYKCKYCDGYHTTSQVRR